MPYPEQLDEQDINMAANELEVFSDVVGDDTYYYVQILCKYHNKLVEAGLIDAEKIDNPEIDGL